MRGGRRWRWGSEKKIAFKDWWVCFTWNSLAHLGLHMYVCLVNCCITLNFMFSEFLYITYSFYEYLLRTEQARTYSTELLITDRKLQRCSSHISNLRNFYICYNRDHKICEQVILVREENNVFYILFYIFTLLSTSQLTRNVFYLYILAFSLRYYSVYHSHSA